MVIDRNSNYQGISLLSPIYKILFSIHLSSLNLYADYLIWYHQCSFWWNLSTPDYVLHSLPTWDTMGVMSGSLSAICRLEEDHWFSWEWGLSLVSLWTTITYQNLRYKWFNSCLNAGNAGYLLVGNVLSFSLISKNTYMRISRTIILHNVWFHDYLSKRIC